MVTTRYAVPALPRCTARERVSEHPTRNERSPREHRPKRAADASNFVHRRKLATETTRRFFFPRRARSFRRAGRHTANVKKWVITLVIGTVTGLLAFAMEHSITVLVRARLTLISRAARAAARLASPPASAAAALAVAAASASALAAAASALVVFVAPAATGAGVALVMASLNGVHIPELLGVKAVAVKAAGAALAVASGAPVGPEGPLVHVGAGVASLCTRQMTVHGGWLDAFHNDADGRDFLSAGVAAGLAAAFGAPVGGVLFSLEEASTHWSHATTWRSLLCAALAVFVSAVARAATPREGAWAGKDSASLMSLSGSTGVIPIDSDARDAAATTAGDDDTFAYFLWELPLFAALAAVAAIIGATLTRVSSAIAPHRPKQPWKRVLEASLVAGTCAAVAVLAAAALGSCSARPARKNGADATRGSADETFFFDADAVFSLGCPRGRANDVGTILLGLRDDIISELLSSSKDFAPASVAVALATLLATTPLACDCAFPAGLFMPTVAWGACLGSLWGVGARALVRATAGAAVAAAVFPSAYAVVGAASALAGMFRSSISLVVIVVEGTGRVGALTPLIVGVAVANLVGPKVHGESFYDAQLRAKGVPFLRHHHACAPTEGDVDDTALPTSDEKKTFENTFGARRVVASLVAAPPRCLSPAPLVGDVVAALKNTTHNGFPVVVPDASENDLDDAPNAVRGRLVGFILRSQLMVLLARRAFVSAEALAAETRSRFFPDDVALLGAPSERLENVFSAHVEATDAAMRTFHHRHHFGDRGVSCSAAAVERLGLSRREMRERVDLRDYMKIAPLAVYAECSAWRAAGYFINAGLRHLPVVDLHNRVVGVLTRRDLVPGFASAASAERAERDAASPEKRTVSP